MFSKVLKAILSSVILSVLISLAYNYSNLIISPHWWWSIIFFTAIFVALYFVFNYKTDPKSATDMLIGATFLKLILLLVAVFVYSLVNKKGLFSFSGHFITHYILFTVFEIRYLISIIKTNK